MVSHNQGVSDRDQLSVQPKVGQGTPALSCTHGLGLAEQLSGWEAPPGFILSRLFPAYLRAVPSFRVSSNLLQISPAAGKHLLCEEKGQNLLCPACCQDNSELLIQIPGGKWWS